MPRWDISSTGTILECLPKAPNFDNMSGVWNTIFAWWPTPFPPHFSAACPVQKIVPVPGALLTLGDM